MLSSSPKPFEPPQVIIHPITEWAHGPNISPSLAELLTKYSRGQITDIGRRSPDDCIQLRYWGGGFRVLCVEEVFLLNVQAWLDGFIPRTRASVPLQGALRYFREAVSAPVTLRLEVELAALPGREPGSWLWVQFKQGRPATQAPDARIEDAALVIPISRLLVELLSALAARGDDMATRLLREAGVPVIRRHKEGLVSADLGPLMPAADAPPPETVAARRRRTLAELRPQHEDA